MLTRAITRLIHTRRANSPGMESAGDGTRNAPKSKHWLGTVILVLAAATALCDLSSRPALGAGRGQPTDWNRFYYYPYLYYPHNFQLPQQYDSLYYRYPPSRRIPVYRKDWYNEYPSERPYHHGHAFILDVL